MPLSDSDLRTLRLLSETEDFPQLSLVQTYVTRDLIKRHQERHDLADEYARRWIARALKCLAVWEARIAECLRKIHINDDNVLGIMVLKNPNVKRLRWLLAHAPPPRFTHVTETINAQRRLMGFILEHHPFPRKAEERQKWLDEFNREYLSSLLVIPCLCNYQESISGRFELEIFACKRNEQLTRLLLADLHGLDHTGIRRLYKTQYNNTSPRL